jgi:hypothetical protein
MESGELVPPDTLNCGKVAEVVALRTFSRDFVLREIPE